MFGDRRYRRFDERAQLLDYLDRSGSFLGVARHHRADERDQFRGQIGANVLQNQRLSRRDFRRHLDRGIGLERRSRREQVHQRRTQTINVAGRSRRGILGAFGRQIRELPRGGGGVRIRPGGDVRPQWHQPEFGQFQRGIVCGAKNRRAIGFLPRRLHHRPNDEVGRSDIAVRDTAVVCRLQPVRRLLREPARQECRHRPDVANEAFEVRPIERYERRIKLVVVRADIEQVHQVCVRNRCSRLRPLDECGEIIRRGQPVGAQSPDHHGRAQARVQRPDDGATGAVSRFVEYRVTGKREFAPAPRADPFGLERRDRPARQQRLAQRGQILLGNVWLTDEFLELIRREKVILARQAEERFDGIGGHRARSLGGSEGVGAEKYSKRVPFGRPTRSSRELREWAIPDRAQMGGRQHERRTRDRLEGELR